MVMGTEIEDEAEAGDGEIGKTGIILGTLCF